ncbi:MAG: ABC transporter substrate-binding protein [Pigmentiphaga sp.]|nr:ABC transporter substrate-binding protein [Pigmentiphaga sp.]
MKAMWFVPPPVMVLAAALNPGAPAVEGSRNTSSDEQFAALVEGRVDMAVTAMDNVIAWNRRAGPRDVRIVAQIERTTPLYVIGRPGLESLADLRGGTILVDALDNGFVVALRALLREAGLGARDYVLEPVGGVTERCEALLAGGGDATLLGPPFDGQATGKGCARLAGVQERYTAFPGQGLVMRLATMKRLETPLRAYLKSLSAAARMMAREEERAGQLLLGAGLPRAALAGALALRPLSLHPDRDGVELLIEHRRGLDMPGGDDTYERLVAASWLPEASSQRRLI